MPTKFKIRKRLNRTKLKVFEKGGWVAGNSSALMEKVTQLIDGGMTTGGATYSAKKAALDVAHAAEDYLCSDYKCLALDTVAAGCGVVATGVSFLPKNKLTLKVFASTTAGSQFCRTLRNECKKAEGGLFGCN